MCLRAAKNLEIMCIKADSLRHSRLADAISNKISCTGPNDQMLARLYPLWPKKYVSVKKVRFCLKILGTIGPHILIFSVKI